MPLTRSQTSKNEEDEQKRENDPLVELLQKEMKKLQTQFEHRMTQLLQEQREYLDTKLTTQERYIADNYKKLNEAFISRSNSRDRTFKRMEDHVFDDDFESEYVPRERLERSNDTPKPKFPSFSGKNDPDAYLDSEEKMEAVFACYNYSDEKKVTYAVAEFINYALTWWNQLCKSRILYREQPVTTWVEMKRILRKRFVPPYYYRELHQRLQHLVQGDRSVDDYYKEMETIQIRANLVEEAEVTMARFLAGLKPEIANRKFVSNLSKFKLIKRVRWHPLSQPCHQLAGVNKFADLVGVTLGPKGRNVVLESKYGSPKIVNDGVTVAKEVVRCCLEHATSVAKTFLMSYCVVVEIKEPEPVPAGNPMDNSGYGY